MKEETVIQRKVMERFSQLGFTPIRMQSGLFYTKNLVPVKVGLTGMPDLMILKPNQKIFWVEMKTEKGQVRNEQKQFADFLHSINHHVYVARGIEDVEKIYKKETNDLCDL